MDESRCVTADRHNFTGYDRAHNYDWNLNFNPLFGDYSSPTWGGMGDFPHYKGRGSGRLMSPQICASLCRDDATEEGCVPRAKTFADADCSFTAGDAASCDPAACNYVADGEPIEHTHFVVGDGRCSCGNHAPLSMPMADTPDRCSSSCSADRTLACGGNMERGLDGTLAGAYWSIYAFDRTTAANKPWETLPSPAGTTSPLYLGGHAAFGSTESSAVQSGAFIGNLADLAIFSRGIEDSEIDCLFRQTRRSLGACSPSSSVRGRLLRTGFRKIQEALTLPPAGAFVTAAGLQFCTHLNAAGVCASQAEVETGLGLVPTEGPLAATIAVPSNFAADSSFTLSIWFTKNWCSNFNTTVESAASTLLAWPSRSGSTSTTGRVRSREHR